MLLTSWPLMSMSALQMAKLSGFSSWPKAFMMPCGLSSCRYSIPDDKKPPVPAVGSYMVRMIPDLVRASSSSMKTNAVVRRTMSRGVKCSPAVSFEPSAKRRISSSKVKPMSWLEMACGLRSVVLTFCTTLNNRSTSFSWAMNSANLKCSNISRASLEKP